MKTKRLYLLLTALLFLPKVSSAQQSAMKLPNSLLISNLSIERVGGNSYDGGKIWLNFDVSTTENISANAILSLLPILTNGTKSYVFPEVKVMKKHALLLARRRGESFAPNTLVLNNKTTGGYSVGVKYRDWMNGATLVFENSAQFCTQNYLLDGVMAQSNIQFAQELIEPQLIMAVPIEQITTQRVTNSAYLDFRVASAHILPDFANNSKELDKIKRDIDNILASSANHKIDRIELCGLSSPEGNYEFNAELSHNRTKALKSYLQDHYDFQNDLFKLSSVAENWEGLRREVRNSPLTNKSEILAIINNKTLSPSQRDAQMKTLPNYALLLKEYYPRLRRVDYTICYDTQSVRSFEEIISLYQISPESLSEIELYSVMNSSMEGSEEYYDIAENWSENLYPQSTVAQINSAVCSIKRQHPNRARKHLRRAAKAMEIQGLATVPDIAAIYFNTSGALELMEGDIKGATILFEQAAKMGLKEGKNNLKLLQMK